VESVLFLGNSALCDWYDWPVPFTKLRFGAGGYRYRRDGVSAPAAAAPAAGAAGTNPAVATARIRGWVAAASRGAIDADDVDVFASGLPSIALFEVLGRVRSEFDASMTLAKWRRTPTAKALGAALGAAAPPPPPPPPAARAPRVPVDAFSLAAAVAVARLVQVGVWRITALERFAIALIRAGAALGLCGATGRRVGGATAGHPTYYAMHPASLVLLTVPVTAPPPFFVGLPLAGIAATLAAVVEAMPFIGADVGLYAGHAFVRLRGPGVPLTARAAFGERLPVAPPATFTAIFGAHVNAGLGVLGLQFDLETLRMLGCREPARARAKAKRRSDAPEIQLLRLARIDLVFRGFLEPSGVKAPRSSSATGEIPRTLGTERLESNRISKLVRFPRRCSPRARRRRSTSTRAPTADGPSTSS